MLSEIASSLAENFMNFIKPLDNPGTYLMCIVIGMVLVPFYIRGVHHHIKNPHEHHLISFETMFWLGFFLIVFLIAFGAVNFIRFLPS